MYLFLEILSERHSWNKTKMEFENVIEKLNLQVKSKALECESLLKEIEGNFALIIDA